MPSIRMASIATMYPGVRDRLAPELPATRSKMNRINRRTFGKAAALLISTETTAMAQSDPSKIVVERASAYDYKTTIDRLHTAIEAAGMRVFASIDHAAGAIEIGMAMPPTLLLIYGHPRGGTPLMLLAPNSALELPLHLLVRVEAGGKTLVCFQPIAEVLVGLGVPRNVGNRLAPAQEGILTSIKEG